WKRTRRWTISAEDSAALRLATADVEPPRARGAGEGGDFFTTEDTEDTEVGRFD
ncbi:MAG: hypothetical protein RIT02_3860, partial [Planctomycetota bacterium]